MSRGPLRSRWLRLPAWVLVVLVACHAAVELADLRFFQPRTDDTLRKLEYYRRRGHRLDVALLGSSRVRCDLTVEALRDELASALGREPAIFNLGVDTGVVATSYVVLRDLLGGERTPRCVVLGVGARGFNANNPIYDRTLQHVASPLDLLGPLGPYEARAGAWIAAAAHLFRAPATLLSLWRYESPAERQLARELRRNGGSAAQLAGELPPDEVDALLERYARALPGRVEAMLDGNLRDFRLEGRGTWAFRRIVELCRERGIALVVLNLPLSGEFKRRVYGGGEYEAYRAHVRALCAELDVRFHDLDAADEPLDTTYFRDGDHLNPYGAERVSRAVARDVLIELLRAPAGG